MYAEQHPRSGSGTKLFEAFYTQKYWILWDKIVLLKSRLQRTRFIPNCLRYVDTPTLYLYELSRSLDLIQHNYI